MNSSGWVRLSNGGVAGLDWTAAAGNGLVCVLLTPLAELAGAAEAGAAATGAAAEVTVPAEAVGLAVPVLAALGFAGAVVEAEAVVEAWPGAAAVTGAAGLAAAMLTGVGQRGLATTRPLSTGREKAPVTDEDGMGLSPTTTST